MRRRHLGSFTFQFPAGLTDWPASAALLNICGLESLLHRVNCTFSSSVNWDTWRLWTGRLIVTSLHWKGPEEAPLKVRLIIFVSSVYCCVGCCVFRWLAGERFCSWASWESPLLSTDWGKLFPTFLKPVPGVTFRIFIYLQKPMKLMMTANS